MRVYTKDDMTAEERSGKWHRDMATRKLVHKVINPSHSIRECHSMRHSNQFTNAILPRLCIMEISGNIRPTSSVSAPMPLNCKCPLAVVEPSTRTAIGRRCNILCCIEFGKGNHYSQSLICNLTLAFEPSASNFCSMPTSYRKSLPPHTIMPRLCERMRSRRGSSRGKLLCSSPSTVFDSSSPSSNYISARYLDTCSSKGRTCVVHSQRSQTYPSASALPSSSQQSNPSAQFTYHCSLNRPIITATITITFQEEPSSDEGRPTRATEKSDTAQGEASAAEQNRETLVKEDTSELPKDEDDLDAYRCLILEEHPSAPNDN